MADGVVSGGRGNVAFMVYREVLWLGCVVCGDTSDFIAVEVHDTEQELMCARCGQARLVPILDAGTRSRSA